MVLFIVILISVFVLLYMLGSDMNEKQQTMSSKLKKEGFNIDLLIPLGNYVGGHYKQDKEVNFCYCYPGENELKFYEWSDKTIRPIKRFSIEKKLITNISVEDASSIESKVTLGRVLLVGLFALAWKKKKKNELYFVSITWKEGNFTHDTIFSFEGNDSSSNANLTRNKLMRLVNESPH